MEIFHSIVIMSPDLFLTILSPTKFQWWTVARIVDYYLKGATQCEFNESIALALWCKKYISIYLL